MCEPTTIALAATAISGGIGAVGAYQQGQAAKAMGRNNQIMAEYADQHVMHENETLDGLLTALREQNAATLKAFADLDLDTLVPIPHEVPWFPTDIDHWTVRWVGMHIIEELSRHAGHADIIRESIDRATMYELLAAAEEWPETEYIKRWRPAAQ